MLRSTGQRSTLGHAVTDREVGIASTPYSRISPHCSCAGISHCCNTFAAPAVDQTLSINFANKPVRLSISTSTSCLTIPPSTHQPHLPACSLAPLLSSRSCSSSPSPHTASLPSTPPTSPGSTPACPQPAASPPSSASSLLPKKSPNSLAATTPYTASACPSSHGAVRAHTAWRERGGLRCFRRRLRWVRRLIRSWCWRRGGCWRMRRGRRTMCTRRSTTTTRSSGTG